jgi:phosphoglucomutase
MRKAVPAAPAAKHRFHITLALCQVLCSARQTVAAADEFSYQDPVDGSISQNQGVRILFENGGRAVFRLSGTGTMGATLRLYLEQFSGINGRCDLDPQEALTPVREAAQIICDMQAKIGRITPDVIT